MFVRLMLAVGLAALLACSSCSPEKRYETLSFFFDGVPRPGEEAPRQRQRGKKRQQHAAAVPAVRGHGPYLAKMCDACHQKRGNNKLILPVEKLCLNCHVLDIGKKHTHGPLAAGGCNICHAPHGSGRPFLLVSDRTQFCFYCHNEAEVGGREVHKAMGDAECTDCHNPHSSDNDFLLR